jgi:hypothetical protein
MGDLEGKLEVTYTGLEAMVRRREMRHADDVARKKFLEDETKEQIPSAAEVELTAQPDWHSLEAPLVATFDLKVSGWAASAGKREILAVGLFSNGEKHIFEHAARVYPIYLQHPYEKIDEITLDLPDGWQPSSLPEPKILDANVAKYDLKADQSHGKVTVMRRLSVNFVIVDPKYYPVLRSFFQAVKNEDELQIVFQSTALAPGR